MEVILCYFPHFTSSLTWRVSFWAQLHILSTTAVSAPWRFDIPYIGMVDHIRIYDTSTVSSDGSVCCISYHLLKGSVTIIFRSVLFLLASVEAPNTLIIISKQSISFWSRDMVLSINEITPSNFSFLNQWFLRLSTEARMFKQLYHQ